ncbi:MAG: hypothetical protein QM758_19860 [Armatimonas sp.]
MIPELSDRNFWIRYLQWRAETSLIPLPEDDFLEDSDEEDEDDEKEEYKFDFKINGRFSLRLETILYYTNLSLYDFDEEIQLGWDDEARWHPHCLRWKELIPLCDYISQQNPDIPYPGWILLLLFRFAPICSNEDAKIAYPALKESWESLGLFSEDEIQRLIETADLRFAVFTWSQDDQGNWSVDQEDNDWKKSGFMLYSLRHVENPDFPWEQWKTLCRQCRIEDYTFNPGEFIFAEQYKYSITFAVNKNTLDRTSEFIKTMAKKNLESKIGTVSTSGAGYDEHGRQRLLWSEFNIRDDKKRFTELFQEVLAAYPDVVIEQIWAQRPEHKEITLEELLLG